MSSRVTYVAETIGVGICAGTHLPGDSLTAESIQEQTGTSRSAVREALGILVTLGLLRVRRRIGYEVQPALNWQLLSPEVVRWQLATEGSETSRELVELRAIIEPAAAAFAAARATTEERAAIAAAGARMWDAAIRSHHRDFVDADIIFHQSILVASRNRLFAPLGALLTESLPLRAPDEKGLSLDEARAHLDLADAIARRDSARARVVAEKIVATTSQD